MRVADPLRQPEYTGENRCGPCTVANLLVTVGLSAATWILVGPWSGVGTFVVCTAAVYFRGYLVPGTPTLTKRYLPAPVLRAFGKEPVADRTVRPVGDDAPSERWLLAAGALDERDDPDGPTLADDFGDRWETAVENVSSGAPTETDLCDALGTDDVSKHADTGAVVEGSRSVRWLSVAAMRADIAAARVFATTVEGWDDVGPGRRVDLCRDLRLFARTCPDCGGGVTLDERTVDPCCERPHTLLEVRCSACETPLADAAVAGTDGTVPSRVRALRE